MNHTEEVVRSIDGRLAEAREEIALLEAALTAFSGQPRPTTSRRRGTKRVDGPPSASQASSGPSRSMPSTNGSASKPRASQSPKPQRSERTKPVTRLEIVPAGKLENLLGASAGLPTSALAEQAGGDRDQVLTLLRELEAAGRIRRTGERRATRWHVITDEDRIAARAAQPASRSKRRRARAN
jgi:hypothetical protein